jgi:predicted ATPase/DNA-binding SARP family transcriptional activator
VKTAADAMRISVLGPLEVSDAGGRTVRVGGHRVRALLILLALDAGRVVPAHALIEKLWPDDRPADAANALQSLISRLRQALRQAGVPDKVIESETAGYRLNVTPAAIDAFAFEEQAKAGSQALARGDAQEAATTLRTALSTWRGAALADVTNEEFAFAPAARLAELQITATLDRVEAEIALGKADAATIGELKELTARDQLAERPATLLIRALAAAGRQSEALAVYQRIKDHLADHLGVDPSPQLAQAYLAVLRQETPRPSTSDAPDRQPRVRRPPTSFVGRDDDVAAVLKRLKTERLVTLTGPGGVGKTRLATEAAARLTVPVWLAELAPVTDPAKVPFAVIDALGLRERSIAPHSAERGGDPVDRLCAALAERDAVLILDNCEHVIDAAAALAARIINDCPKVKILATSREPLQIPGETLHVVDPLATHPAVRLFADRAAAVLPGFDLSPANSEVIARICRTLDGMPLAIELATPWLRTLPPAQLAARLDDRFALLTSGSRTALPRHQTLRAVVDWSWDLLSERERVLSRRLAVFPGGATLAAAEQVCTLAPGQGEPGQGEPGQGEPGQGEPGQGEPGQLEQGGSSSRLPASAVLTTLAGLVSKSLLARIDTEDSTEPRYRMLDTVRAYGLERLAEAGEDTRTRDAAARYYLEYAEIADPQLRTKTQAYWFRALTAEQDNINAAIRWSVAQGDAATALRLLRALGYYWIQRGHGEADSLCRDVLAMTPPPLTLQLAEGRVICAILAAGWAWDIDSIRAPLTEALAAVSSLSRDYEAIHPLVAMTEPVVLQYDGVTEQAQQYFERYVTARDPWLRAVGKVYVASYAMSLGKLDGAEESCRAGLAELRGLGEQWGVAMALTTLAEFTELRADHAASIEAITEAVATGREIGVWGDLTYVEARLGVLHARAGDLNRGYAELAQVQRKIEARGGQVDTDRWVLFMMAELACHKGDYAEAARCCEAVLTVIAPHGAPWWQSLRAQVKARLAIAALKQGDRARCARLLTESLDATATWSEHPALAVVLDACAVYAQSRAGSPDPELSARLLGAATAVRGAFDESSLDAPSARACAVTALGKERYETAYNSEAASTYESALALARTLF